MDSAQRFISIQIVRDKPYKHSWINARRRDVFRWKQLAIGTPNFLAARDTGAAGLATAYGDFIRDTRMKLLKAAANDSLKISISNYSRKMFWKLYNCTPLSGILLQSAERQGCYYIGHVRFEGIFARRSCEWLLANITSAVSLGRFLLLRQRTIYNILRYLDTSFGTSPDGLPTNILKQNAS